MVASTWADLTKDLDAEDLAKLQAFRDHCRGLPDTEERISTSQIAYAGERVFASAYVKNHYLEVGIELLREVTDPHPRATFATSARVTIHRYSLREIDQFDEPIRTLISEAATTVGPGFRG